MDGFTDRTEFRLIVDMQIVVTDPVALRVGGLTASADEESPGNEDLAVLVRRMIAGSLLELNGRSDLGFRVSQLMAHTRNYEDDDCYPEFTVPASRRTDTGHQLDGF